MLLVCLYVVTEQVSVFFHQIKLEKGFDFDKSKEVLFSRPV